ncbi:hypothetical protein [Rhodovulum sp. ES.010]|uniref:hypothetical protein n=1 Tax=Rhodovulum sp. ES.010 TaxID=1882821 RepID=UPI0020C9F8FB|nr:hypothetical protein [Rhodovulum sp. ES.010]
MSLLAGSSLFRAQGAMAPLVPRAPASAGQARGASLFAGREGGSLFAPRPGDVPPAKNQGADLAVFHPPAAFGDGAAQAERIRHLISRAESPRHGYDAVQHGAKRRPAEKPTEMTIAEIYAWIAATPGQPHAIGRYQFIPATLKRLVKHLGLDHRTVFSPAVQDRLADLLLEEAGYGAFLAGTIGRTRFMNNLARIWAGLPTSSGRSHYHGYAGNKATMTWARFDAEMAKIFPG